MNGAFCQIESERVGVNASPAERKVFDSSFVFIQYNVAGEMMSHGKMGDVCTKKNDTAETR